MALIVEDGSGRADAESPNSVAELDAYHLREGNADWTGSEADKERWARLASLEMERLYADRASGRRKVLGQALTFPRASSYTLDGASISPDSVPAPWKAMHAELSLRAKRQEILRDVDRGGQLTSFSIGPQGPDRVIISKSYAAGAPAGKSFPVVEARMGRLLRPANELRSLFPATTGWAL